MNAERYAIVDIETTGGRANLHRITEIAIVLHDGKNILDTFESLVNPETWIPYGITELTGITQEMVHDAPRFYEIARTIVEMTEGAVFVAHNVSFDYNFIREEFARLGFVFSRRQLCTVRLSRKAFPGLTSYGLDNLIRYMGIHVSQRHRAMGDALATAELFRRIFDQQNGPEQARAMIKAGLKEARLPENFGAEKVMALPEACGVYYLHNAHSDVIYVGKSQNIRKRILEHFADKSEKSRKLRELTYDITFEITGSELAALLLESFEIKRLRPEINRAQRQTSFPFAIHTFHDSDGFHNLVPERLTASQRKKVQVVGEYPTLPAARGRLEWAVTSFELCRRLSGLQTGKGACFDFHLRKCHGACAGLETPESYNVRVAQAIQALEIGFSADFLLIERGRHPEERTIFLIENGQFAGYGYCDVQEGTCQTELRNAVKSMPANPEINRIIMGYLHKKPSGMSKITLESDPDSP